MEFSDVSSHTQIYWAEYTEHYIKKKFELGLEQVELFTMKELYLSFINEK